MLQKRSFFGVLSVEDTGLFHRLVHGTTLHGKQFAAGRSRDTSGIEDIRFAAPYRTIVPWEWDWFDKA